MITKEKVLSRDRLAEDEVDGDSVIDAVVDDDNEVITVPLDVREYLPVNVMRGDSDSGTLIERVTKGKAEAVKETEPTEDIVTKTVNVLVRVVCTVFV